MATMKSQPPDEALGETIPHGETLVQKATVEDYAKKLGTPAWLFAAARAYHQWPIGKETGQGDYEAALKKVLGERYGY
jgi:hypothetical protein